MTNRYWLFLTALISASALAQPAAPITTDPATTNVLSPAPPPLILTGTNATAPAKTKAPAKSQKKKVAAKKPAKKPAAKKPNAASTIRSEPLTPGPAIVVASNVNVRGQARLTSEVVTRLTKGDTVTVLEEVMLKNSKPDEPSAWAKIMFPTKAHVWVNSSFIDANKTVVPKKLNLRTGPGENYSVVGTLQKGDVVKEVQVKENWTEIEAPANAFAFMAAAYLKKEAATPPPEPPPTPTEITAVTPVAPPPTETPVIPSPEPSVTNPPVAPAPAPIVKEEPPPKRIVQREGIVRGTVSIQAPTPYSLISPETGKTINYLYTASRHLDLSRYKGLRIIVTGEEGLDERWPNTPVITIQKIQVLE